MIGDFPKSFLSRFKNNESQIQTTIPYIIFLTSLLVRYSKKAETSVSLYLTKRQNTIFYVYNLKTEVNFHALR